MRETWLLEAKRLQAAGLKCYNRGMARDGDITALGVHSKLVERPPFWRSGPPKGR